MGNFKIRPTIESSPKLKLFPRLNPAPKVDVAAPQRALRPEYDRRYTREQASLTKVEQVSSYLGEAKLGREGGVVGQRGGNLSAARRASAVTETAVACLFS